MNIICCMRTCFLLTVALVVLAFAAGTTFAADVTYKRGHDQSYTAGCTDPATRTDGTAIAAGEIAEVVYYVDAVGGLTGSPLLTINMTGGCMDVPVDLQQFPVNVELGKYATAETTDGLVSEVGVGPTFVVQSANPNAPGQIK